jgi:hypothetical protein
MYSCSSAGRDGCQRWPVSSRSARARKSSGWASSSQMNRTKGGSAPRPRAADPPSSKARAGSQGNTRRRGGGPLRSGRNPLSETDGGKQMEGNSPGKSPQARSGGLRLLLPSSELLLLPVSRGRGVKPRVRRQGERCFRREGRSFMDDIDGMCDGRRGPSWPTCRDLLSSSAALGRAGLQTMELEEAPSDDRSGTRSASSADHDGVG